MLNQPSPEVKKILDLEFADKDKALSYINARGLDASLIDIENPLLALKSAPGINLLEKFMRSKVIFTAKGAALLDAALPALPLAEDVLKDATLPKAE